MVKNKEQIRNVSSLEKFILHLHPSKIDSRAIRFTRTFGLGGINALLFLILLVTGMVLRFSYAPTVQLAYDSIVELQANTTFGQFIRNLHYVSANLMIIVSFLHLIRTYYSQAIYRKRAKNWIYGLISMFMVFAASFTGYLLPWDQLAYWAVTVIIQIIEYIPLVGNLLADMIRGGETIGANTLLIFYSLHTGVIPILFIFLMSMHFWLVRKAGGVALPKKENNEIEKVSVITHLVRLEFMVAVIVVAGLFLFSVFYNAPLQEQANPLNSPNPAKAPWYFLGAQELLLHIHPAFSAVIILILAGFFFYLPYFKYTNLNIGVWFNSGLGKRMTINSAIFALVFTFLLIYLLEHFLHLEIWFAGLGGLISTGLIPFLLYSLPMSGYLVYWKKVHNAKSEELFMAITTILISSYITMLLVSLFLRGEGMLMIF